MSKQIYFLIIGFVGVFLILIAYILYVNLFQPQKDIIYNTGTSVGGVDQPKSLKDQQINQQSSLIQALVDKTPHIEKNFSLYYNFNDNQFVLHINLYSETQGNIDFDNFLKQNGVMSRSWFTNLVILKTPISPATTPTLSPKK